MSPRLLYRAVAIAEAITWTLLISAMIAKYGFDNPTFVPIAGGLHGLIFISYVVTAVLVGVNQRWKISLILAGVGTAIIPFATIPFDIWLDRRGRLDGGWRTTATDDPRDHTPFGRLFRWFLTHPVLLIVVGIVAIAVIMVVLLMVGPPGGSH